MKLQATVGDSQSDVEIRADGNRVFAVVDDRSYELEVHGSGAGNCVMIADGRVFDCRVEGRAEAGRPIDVFVGASLYPITLTDPKRLRGAASVGAHADGAARIVSPMPGKVVRVLVQIGDQIETGAGIAVVEAMKMQNEMKSPKAGTVVALKVHVGATVDGGDVLAIIE